MMQDPPPTNRRESPSARSQSKAKDFPPPLFEVQEFTFHFEDKDSKLIITSSGKRIIIRLSEDRFSTAPQLKERYLFFLQLAKEGGYLDDYTLEDFEDWVVEPFLPMLERLAESGADSVEIMSLDDYLYAETLSYDIGVDNVGQLSPIQCETTESDREYLGCGINLPDSLFSSWPSYQPSEVQLCDDQHKFRRPRKVIVPGSGTSMPLYLKYIAAGDNHSTTRELSVYQQLRELDLGPDVYVSRLHGVVRDGRGTVFGLLLSYIDCGGVTLTCALGRNPSASLRTKWKTQIYSTVDLFHNAGIIWGDVKSDNVLVDRQDNAWVIDFGGGYTEGWVDKEQSETLAGDVQGLSNLIKRIET